jgi:hypothetical protein
LNIWSILFFLSVRVFAFCGDWLAPEQRDATHQILCMSREKRRHVKLYWSRERERQFHCWPFVHPGSCRVSNVRKGLTKTKERKTKLCRYVLMLSPACIYYSTTTYVVYASRLLKTYLFNGAAQSSEREYKGDDISDGQGRRRQRQQRTPLLSVISGRSGARRKKTDHFSFLFFEFSRGFFFFLISFDCLFFQIFIFFSSQNSSLSHLLLLNDLVGLNSCC